MGGFRCRGAELSFITTKTTFGMATEVTVAELSIESLFPADPPTAEAMRALVKTQPRDGNGRSPQNHLEADVGPDARRAQPGP
jgi:hypothetical protein